MTHPRQHGTLPGRRYLLPPLAYEAQIAAAGAALEIGGWLEYFDFDSVANTFRANPGVKMRKLTPKDLLEL
jgi:hypothetical protein